jgi:hypothetical protein
MFAKRKKSPFKGPGLNSAFFHTTVPAALGSPAVVGMGQRQREGSEGHLNRGLKRFGSLGGDSGGRRGNGKRKSLILEEEEEEEAEEEEVRDERANGHRGAGVGFHGGLPEEEEEEDEEEIEEVDAFQSPELDLAKGERVQSITILDEGDEDGDGMTFHDRATTIHKVVDKG